MSNNSITHNNVSTVSNFSDISIWTTANTTPLHIFITFINVILITLILIGNSLTILAVTKFKHLRQQSSVMLAALAVADLIMGVAYTPIRLLRNHLPHLFRLKPPCYVFMFVGHFASVTAILFLSLLSFERFYSIQFPFHYHVHATVKSAFIFSSVTFAVVAAVMVPLVSGAAMWYEGVQCYAPTLYPSFYTRIIVAMCFGPLILGFIAFLRVCFVEFRFRKKVQDQNVISMRMQESLKTKLILTVYVVSLCFWIPHIIFYFYDTISKADLNLYLFRAVSFLDLGSSAINCFLYAWKNSKFKAAYKQLLGFKRSVELLNSSVTLETT